MRYKLFLLLIFAAYFADAQCYLDRHSLVADDGWLSCDAAANPNSNIPGDTHWIMYDLGEPYDLWNIHVWNYNHPTDTEDGLASFSVSISENGTNWFIVDTFYINQSDASGFYEGEVVGSIGGKTSNYLIITGINNYGGDCYGLSEIKMSLQPPEEPCEDKIAMDLILAPGIIGSNGDIVFVTIVVVNTGNEPLANVNLQVEEDLFSGDPYTTTLSPTFQGDPNGNGLLDIGEIWYYNAVKSYDYDQGDVFIVSGGVVADAECGQVSSGAGKLLFTVITNSLMPDPELEAEYLNRLSALEQSDIYPNPVRSGDIVNIPAAYYGEQDLKVYNVRGELVSSKRFNAERGSIQKITTDGFSPGTYFINTGKAAHKQSYKLIVYD